MLKRILIFAFIFLNYLTVCCQAISARSAVLIDSASGRVLYEHNAYEKLPMASTTKIMTGILACESGKLSESVKVSPFASGTEGSSLWLKIGEKLTLEELTYGLMLKSGNDAAVAIAEYLGGSVDAFALLMNKRARKIGAKNTNFVNPHGLDAEGHYTTAFDLALIAREAMKNDKFREIVSTKTYSIPMQGEKWNRALKNHNKLLWNYEGCNGVKTGFTKKCGRCLVSSAERNGRELICITLNAPDDWKDHTYMLNYGFDSFDTEVVAKKGEYACNYVYDGKNNRSVNLYFGDDYIVSVAENDVIETEITYEKIILPAEKGIKAGSMIVCCNGKKISEIDLITDKKLNKLSLLQKVKHLFHKIFK